MVRSVLGWPYAVKAIVQHESTGGYLNLWLTFAHDMDEDSKPGHDLWVCTADGTPRAISTSVWVDAWTLLLTTVVFDGVPDRVLLAYGGPSPTLQTSWGKQWEPWGPILSLDITT